MSGPLVRSVDLTELLLAAIEMGAASVDTLEDEDNEDLSQLRTINGDLHMMQTKKKSKSFKLASPNATASLSKSTYLSSTANTYVAGYYESLERTKLATLRAVDHSIAMIARRAAETIACRVESRLLRCVEGLCLHVAACRYVVESLKGVNLQLIRDKHASAGELRRRVIKILTRVIAVHRSQDNEDHEKACNSNDLVGKDSFSILRSKGVRWGDKLQNNAKLSTPKSGSVRMSQNIARNGENPALEIALSLAARYNFEAVVEQLYPSVFEDASVPREVRGRASKHRPEGQLDFWEENDKDIECEKALLAVANEVIGQSKDSMCSTEYINGAKEKNTNINLNNLIDILGKGADGGAPTALRRLKTGDGQGKGNLAWQRAVKNGSEPEGNDDEDIDEEDAAELERPFTMALAELSAIMYEDFNDNEITPLSACELSGGYTATALYYGSSSSKQSRHSGIIVEMPNDASKLRSVSFSVGSTSRGSQGAIRVAMILL